MLVPAGWHAQVWARLAGARFAARSPNGELLVSVPVSGEVVALTPRADPAAPPRERVLLAGLIDPEGLGFTVAAGRSMLVVAEADQLDRYTWIGLRRTVVAGTLPDADGLERAKGLAIGADGTVYLGVGSDSRQGGPRGVILAVAADGRRAVALRGVRYAEGLALDPTGRLWVAVNSAGQAPDELVTATHGRKRAERLLQPHAAPLGLTFLTRTAIAPPWRDGAVLAVHGARDPTSRSVPGLLFLPWNGRTLGSPTSLASGFQLGTSRWGRPTDAVAGPDGSLYVVDDTAGAVYRLTPPPS
jgi:glucose/arabinose dehydrogenase